MEHVEGCVSCEEYPAPEDPIEYDFFKCPNSIRDCGHHCNHFWSHEICCWCKFTLISEGT